MIVHGKRLDLLQYQDVNDKAKGKKMRLVLGSLEDEDNPLQIQTMNVRSSSITRNKTL